MRNVVPMSTYRLADQIADQTVDAARTEDWRWPGQEAGFDFLSLLSASNRRRILEGSTRSVYPAGTIVVKPDGPPSSYVIDRGLARFYWTVPDGREATVAFVHPKELIGERALVGHPSGRFVKVIIESTLTKIGR